ncbi:hypothetical protein VA7868_04513 [Vibrio aerogenes CECT 7868]|uniref:Uncharacterized protein n=1 Tax=Vibrio aerogenes CECT 7868 TaxID=1216006 RepID=A0A1M6ESF3_9VIBR|nr:DUF1488 domain-containing protein [Vibrio aerogenes]SHI88335.1 hypothetical protein VA7868_04513 [Vibrio aerogenes CECT 7868]
MNQSVIFSDVQYWCDETQQVCFSAQLSGLLIECFISLPALEKISAQTIVDSHNALDVFTQYRFDIEELAENAIEDDRYDEQGRIVIF